MSQSIGKILEQPYETHTRQSVQLLLEARIDELQKLPKLCLIDEHKLSDHIEELKVLRDNYEENK